jgi:hypothetical protein
MVIHMLDLNNFDVFNSLYKYNLYNYHVKFDWQKIHTVDFDFIHRNISTGQSIISEIIFTFNIQDTYKIFKNTGASYISSIFGFDQINDAILSNISVHLNSILKH